MVSTLPKPNTQHGIITGVVHYETYQVVIHSLRHAVFVCEQAIPASLEIDEYDPISQHVLAWWQGKAVGTGRLTPDGRIGRVAVAYPNRRRGVGRCVMEKLLEIAKQNQHREVVLAAQYHAVPFYERLGFYPEGERFKDLGIDHVMMRKILQ